MSNRRNKILPNQSQLTREEETRAAIIEAAMSLIQRYGIRKTTMNDIAHAMGKQKSFLYYYYRTKQDIMVALGNKFFAEISEKVRKKVETKTNAMDRLVNYLVNRVQLVAEQFAFYRLTIPELQSWSGDTVQFFHLAKQRRKFDEVETRYLANIISQGVNDGQFRHLSEEAIMSFTQFVFSAIRGIEMEMFMDPDLTKDLHDRLEISCDIAIRGILR